MTNDIRVLARKRFEAGKDLHTPVQAANRHERRAAQRHAKILEASRIRVIGQRTADSSEEKGQKGTLRGELAAQQNVPGFARTSAGLLVPLAVALELAAAACGAVVSGDTDSDVAPDTVEDVQQDEASPDADVPEVEQDGDVGHEEGIGPDADVEATDAETDADLDDGTDVEEDGGEEDVVDVPDDTPVCDPIIHDETRTPVPSGSICGITKEKIVTVRITDYPEGCGMPRSTSLESVLFRVLGPLPADLTCARGEETEGLNSGVFLIVGLTPTELQMGLKLASGLHLGGGEIINGGTYQLRFIGVAGTLGTETWLLDAAGAVIDDGFRVPVTWEREIDPNNGAITWHLNTPVGTASLGIIRLPLEIATDTHGIQYFGIGDEGWFTAHFSVDGAGTDDSWRFDRDHTK